MQSVKNSNVTDVGFSVLFTNWRSISFTNDSYIDKQIHVVFNYQGLTVGYTSLATAILEKVDLIRTARMWPGRAWIGMS